MWLTLTHTVKHLLTQPLQISSSNICQQKISGLTLVCQGRLL